MTLAQQLINLFASLLLLISFAMLAQRRVLTLINLFAWQGLILAISAAVVAWTSNQHHLYYSAGLTLLLEQVSRGERVVDVFQPENLQAVFDYLAIQVYARASAEDQRTLLELCWLSRIPSAALQVLCPECRHRTVAEPGSSHRAST